MIKKIQWLIVQAQPGQHTFYFAFNVAEYLCIQVSSMPQKLLSFISILLILQQFRRKNQVEFSPPYLLGEDKEMKKKEKDGKDSPLSREPRKDERLKEKPKGVLNLTFRAFPSSHVLHIFYTSYSSDELFTKFMKTLILMLSNK